MTHRGGSIDEIRDACCWTVDESDGGIPVFGVFQVKISVCPFKGGTQSFVLASVCKSHWRKMKLRFPDEKWCTESYLIG